LDRFKLYTKLKSNINLFDNAEIRKRLDIMISPLYLQAIKYNEGSTSKYFSELSTIEKLRVLPLKGLQILKSILNTLNRIKAKKISPNLPQNKIVFYPIEPTHLNQMVPVSKNLSDGSFYFITDRISIYNELKRLDIICYLINFINFKKKNIIDISSLGNGLIKTEDKLKWESDCKHYLQYFYDILESNLQKTLEIIKPEKVVIGYDITPEGRMFTYLCKDKNIPSICIQHGSIAGEPMDGEHIVDNYILFGLKPKEYLLKIGNSPESLKVFGAPYLDAKLGNRSDGSKLRRDLGIPNGSIFILVALSGPGHCTTKQHFNKIVSSLVRFANKNQSYRVVFKLHRKDNASNYTEIFKEIGFQCLIVESGDVSFPNDIFYWLDAADILVTGSSTVALEAMLLKVPVMTIDYYNEYQNIDFIEGDCTYHVSSEENLKKMFNHISDLDNELNNDSIMQNAQNYINQYFQMDEIPASVKIAQWLKE
jgi:hypothetical protein